MKPALTEAGGRRLYWYCLLTALMLSLGMPGHFGWWPLLFIALVPLCFISLSLSPFKSALAGFVTGLLYHLLLIYWIVIVLGRYGGLPVWITVPALILLSAYMSCYTALFAGLLSLIAGRYWHKERSIATLVWVAPVLWVGLDYLRSVFLTGFPWLDLGYGLYKIPQLIQAADLGGHYLVSFCLVLTNGLVVAIIDRQRKDIRYHLRAERFALLMACSFLVFAGGYSGLRYKVMAGIAARSLQGQVAVVQGNIDQSEKWSQKTREKTVTKYVELSRSVLGDKTTELVVWPETALPFYPQRHPLASHVRDFTRQDNLWLLTGAPSFDSVKEEDGEGLKRLYFNSALLIGPQGTFEARYVKQHLVPFGEYVPLRGYLPFLEPVVESIGDFTAGRSSKPLVIGQMRLGILICFESIFPQIARQAVFEGANLLVNLTNDAWYGRSSAPYQSMAMSVFRAVETKRTLIRAANTGISGFVDPVGNIMAQTSLFEEAALSSQVPMVEKRTVFTQYGYLFGAACLSLIPALVLFRRK